MTNYRRLYLQNYPIFITMVTFHRNPIHLHLILNTKNNNEYSGIISSIKSYFSKNINRVNLNPIKEKLTSSNIKKREKGV